MTPVTRTDDVTMARSIGMPKEAAVRLVQRPIGADIVVGADRPRDIGSLMALSLAVAASIMLTGLLWIVL